MVPSETNTPKPLALENGIEAAEGSAMTPWVTRLLNWFERHQRRLPWRHDDRPYYVWLSEVMLQQTQVDTVIPYFERFVRAFPDVPTLAAADQQAVLKLWEGLGYYSRARNLHKTAQLLMTRHGGKLPEDPETLRRLPGFGPYTTAAVGSIAFGHALPVVDGNVLRVFCRFWGIDTDIRQPRVRTELQARLAPFIAAAPPSAFNQAIMEVGALVCRPQAPRCEACPLQADCVAFQTGRTAELPVKSARKPVPHYQIVAGIVWKDGKFLLERRCSAGCGCFRAAAGSDARRAVGVSGRQAQNLAKPPPRRCAAKCRRRPACASVSASRIAGSSTAIPTSRSP